MAGKRRHWKEKNGRFWARVAVPKAVQPILGKTELIEPLGGDRRDADRNHAAAVARLQEQILQAERAHGTEAVPSTPITGHRKINAADYEDATWNHFNRILQNDEVKRAAMPTSEEIDSEYERFMRRLEAGEFDANRDPFGMLNAHIDYDLKAGARHFDTNLRNRRLTALRSTLSSGDTRFVATAVQQYIDGKKLDVAHGSTEWRDLAHNITRAEIAALHQTLGRDSGDYAMQPSDPIVKPPSTPDETLLPVPLKQLFCDYIETRKAIGKHRDGGANWEYQIDSLIKFLGHSDARKITKRNLLDWRDSLMASGKSAKTVSDKSLAAIKAVLRWAFHNDRLPTNEAATVRQEIPKKIQRRERGYTTPEAVEILRTAVYYQPADVTNLSNRESEHRSAAKRWVPLLCAFTGARVTEITQLRKEDIQLEGDRWLLRITPDAGSVKTGHYRDVPLHKQILELGFIDFVKAVRAGPLFHGATTPDKFLSGARVTSGKLSEWLQSLQLVPENVQPSYGWRHRFKTQGRELAMSDRVLDAIQGHPGKTASDSYGDVTVAAKLRVIDALPHYDLNL